MSDGVTWTVKEIVERIDRKVDTTRIELAEKLDVVEEKLDAKPDRTLVETIEHRIDAQGIRITDVAQRIGRLENEVSTLQVTSIGQVAIDRYRKWVLPLLIGLATSAGTLAGLLIHHH